MKARHTSPFAALVRKMAKNEMFLAYWLEQWMQRNGKTLIDVSLELGCEVEVIYNIAMCYAPRAGRVQEDIMQVAKKFDVSASALTRLVFLM